MSLIVLEGLDRSGKTSLAEAYEKEGYEIVHLSAPDKKYTQVGYTGPSYLDDMVEIIQQAALKDIVLDRSHYGELIWSLVYDRKPLLSIEDIEILREIEDSVGTRRILMHDPDTEGHWKRCVDNNEPLTRTQFLRARNAYSNMASKYGFEKIIFSETPTFKKTRDSSKESGNGTQQSEHTLAFTEVKSQKKTKEQLKLEKANAINEILSKRIVKGKSEVFDEIETEVRNFLNKKMGTILGSEDKDVLSQEEVLIIKAFVKRLKEKDAK